MSNSPNIPAPPTEAAPSLCKFCGRNPVGPVPSLGHFAIFCGGCGATIQGQKTTADAIAAWNHRATPQPPAADVREMAKRITVKLNGNRPERSLSDNDLGHDIEFEQTQKNWDDTVYLIAAELQPWAAERADVREMMTIDQIADRAAERLCETTGFASTRDAVKQIVIYALRWWGYRLEAERDDLRGSVNTLAMQLREARAERDRLKAIVDALPKTADGQYMPIGSTVYYDNRDHSLTYVLMGNEDIIEMEVISMCLLGEGLEFVGLLEFGSSVSARGKVSNCYSTKEAALASQAEGGEVER